MKEKELIEKQTTCLQEIVSRAEEIREMLEYKNIEEVRQLGMKWIIGAVKMLNDCTEKFLRIAKPICCLDLEDDDDIIGETDEEYEE